METNKWEMYIQSRKRRSGVRVDLVYTHYIKPVLQLCIYKNRVRILKRMGGLDSGIRVSVDR